MEKNKKENKVKRKRGDRYDGTLIRGMDGLHAVMPHLMDNRTDAEVYINESIDVTELLAYLKKKNEENPEQKTTLFHAMATAVAKTVTMRPYLNRFIAGRRFYERNELILAFVAKRQFADHAEESLMLLRAKPEHTLDDFSRIIRGDVRKIRTEGNNDMDDVLDLFAKFPRWLLKLVVGILRILDYHGKVPHAIADNDSNYSTVFLSNLGSIKCNAVYHHLNNYGTNSIMGTIGVAHKEQVVDDEGNISIRDVVELGLTLDERIADGFYFARSVKLLKHIIARPELLELPLRESFDYEY